MTKPAVGMPRWLLGRAAKSRPSRAVTTEPRMIQTMPASGPQPSTREQLILLTVFNPSLSLFSADWETGPAIRRCTKGKIATATLLRLTEQSGSLRVSCNVDQRLCATFALFHRREIRWAKPDYVGLFQRLFNPLRFRYLLKFRIETECLPVLLCLLPAFVGKQENE
jgi:hypothetical protein